MSAGFKIADQVFWGSNGAVETYVESLADLAEARFGPDDPLAAYLAEQRESWSMGRVLYLDEWLATTSARERFLNLLDAATDQILQEGTFTEYGRDWVLSVIGSLRARATSVGVRAVNEDASGRVANDG